MSGHAAVSAYGRLTGDPRAIETQTGNPMTVGRLAVALPCRENGEDGEAAAFFGLVAFGEPAESLARHVKGDTVGAFGRIKINRFTNRDGEAREELSIMADGLVSARTVRPVGGRKNEAAATATAAALPFEVPATERKPKAVAASRPVTDQDPITDDDIPF